jgi:CRP/FNR family cyclic AMP-dependent transcriptional regulator
MTPKKHFSFDPKKFLAEVGKGRTSAVLQEGSLVFTQGDAADGLFYIHKGTIKLTVVSKVGKEAVIAVLGAGMHSVRSAKEQI